MFPWFSSGAALVGLLFVILLYHPDRDAVRVQAPPVAETLRGMWRAMKRLRFLALILITAGFWAIQGQLYAAMPKYVLRLVGEGAAPEWYANINPFVVVLFVVPVTHLIRRWRPEAAIAVAMMMIPFSALAMSLSPLLGGDVTIFGVVMHPITAMMIIGISIQGLAECFLSPKYLEYASRQAPAGEEGLYLGFAHMNTFFAWLFGFVLSGFLLERYCPDPRLLDELSRKQWEAAIAGQGAMPAAYAQAHYLWYAWAIVGGLSFLALLIYVAVTRRIDARTGS
ncbi:MAG: hypothetical protein Q9Q13_03010 [Acidobacteriota bacterium]|nr:hypothetical protein [Acidobacteriota bacterium]